MQIRILSMTSRDGGAEILVRVELSEDVFDVAGGSAAPPRKPQKEVRELLLLLDQYAELRPQKGVIDEEAFGALERSAELCEAVRMGLRLLVYGAGTRRGLENKLCRKGVARETASEASDYLAARGYLDEERDAVREAERCVRKLRGRNRILAVLYQKGYDPAAIAAAERYLDGVDFVLSCKALIERRYGTSLSDGNERKRVIAALMRNGYTMREIRAAFSDLL